MKTSLIISLLIILPVLSIQAQDCAEYSRLISEGDIAFYNSDYERAVKRYNLAMLNCPEKIIEVQVKILDIFKEIEKLKNIAEQQKRIAEQERNIEKVKRQEVELKKERLEKERNRLELEKAKVDSLLNQKQNLENIINSFYFQNYYPVLTREILTNENGKNRYVRYGFKDNFGNTQIEPIYEKASIFDNSGYAKVKRKKINYLINVSGSEYLRSDSLNQLNDNNIVAIDLRNQGITSKSIENSSLFTTNQLKIILLSNNKIDSIPTEISNLKELQTLNLNKNKINDLPVEISELQQLRILELSSNRFTNLPLGIVKLKQLQTLDLSNNTIDSLPPIISELKQLKTLDLSNNKLSSLPSGILELKQLEVLDLSGNELLVDIPIEILELEQLQTLILKGNNFQDMQKTQYILEKIAERRPKKKDTIEEGDKSLTSHNSQLYLTFRTIKGNKKRFGFIDKEGKTKIDFEYDEALQFEANGYAKVKRNNIYYLIDTLGIEYPLIEDIQQLNKSITAIDLRDKGLFYIPNEVLNSTQLKILLLDKNNLVDIPRQIGQLKQLEALHLSDNSYTFYDIDIHFLGAEIKQLNELPQEIGLLKSLKKLNLSNNNFSDQEKEKIKKLLPNCYITF